MDIFEQAFAAAAEVSSDESWTRLQKYEEKEYYSVTDVEINLDERTIGDLSGNVSTMGEDNSQYIQFIMDRYADGVDLTTMLIQVQYRLEDGQESVSAPVNAYASESRIRFGWPISRVATQKEQTIQFIVFCTGNRQDGEPYVLKTKPIKHKIEFTLGIGGTIIAPDEDWFLQFENLMNEKVNQVASLASIAIDSAAVAKESKERVAEDRSVVEELAPQVKSDAESAKISEENAKEWYNKTVAHSGVNYASEELAGVVSPQGIYVNPENGKMHMTMETTETAMPNSHKGRLMVEEIGGVMEQDSTTGKNLLDCSGLTAQTINGVTFTPAYAENGTLEYINVNGTASASVFFKLQNAVHLNKTEEYVMSGCPSGGGSSSFRIFTQTQIGEYNSFDDGSGTLVNIPPNDPLQVFIVVYSGYEATNLHFYPMVREAGTDATYEPYTNGPSPNPSYPQEIRNVAISGIKTHGKNMANFQNAQNSDRGTFAYTKETAEKIVATKNASGGKFVARYVANLKADTIYNFSLTENAYQVYVYYDKLYGTAYKTFSNTNNATFTPTQDGVYVIGIFVPSSVASGSEVTVSNFMIEEGAEATPYEPYTESSITFSQPIELYGLDDVRDILTSKQISRKYAKVVFDGSDDEAWNGSSTIGRYYMNNFGCKGYGILMCSYAKGVQNGNELINTCYIHAASNGRFIINTEIPTLAEWKAHLQANPMTVVYELAEETTEELPIADQIALNNLLTYAGITHVEFISEIKPTFKGEYGTSKVGGYTLEALLTARSADLKATAAQTTEE